MRCDAIFCEDLEFILRLESTIFRQLFLSFLICVREDFFVDSRNNCF